MEEKAFGKRRQLHGSSDPIVPMGYRQEEARRDSWGPEGSMDTDVLLKDTETLMRNLEERMRTKRQMMKTKMKRNMKRCGGKFVRG